MVKNIDQEDNNTEQNENNEKMNDLWIIEETTKSSLSTLINDIKTTVHDFLEKSWLLNIFKELWINFNNETKDIVWETQWELDYLAKNIINIQPDKLKNNKIEKNVEIQDSIENDLNNDNTLLWKLIKSEKDGNIKNWFEWILEKDDNWNYIIDDNDIISWEFESILLNLREKSDNKNNLEDWIFDLTQWELDEIWTLLKSKKELCENVLTNLKKDKYKEIPDDKKNKKNILKIYNELYTENKWNIENITEETIIKKIVEDNNI